MSQATGFEFHAGTGRLSGPLTCDSVTAITDAVLGRAAGEGDLTLDLSAVGRCDSAAVALLACCLQRKRRLNAGLELCNVPAELALLLDVYGLAAAFVPARNDA